jgi:hypothetical protein
MVIGDIAKPVSVVKYCTHHLHPVVAKKRQ